MLTKIYWLEALKNIFSPSCFFPIDTFLSISNNQGISSYCSSMIKVTLYTFVTPITSVLFNVDWFVNFQRSKSIDWFLYDNGLCHERVMFGMCNEEHKKCLLIVSKIWSNRRIPELINYQLWTSYTIFFGLKYLLHFFGWLHLIIRILKSNCMWLSCHIRVLE